jgi:hypothetical protein
MQLRKVGDQLEQELLVLLRYQPTHIADQDPVEG